MRHWLCCDGGGTKLIVLLVNERLEIVRSATAGGVNPNFIAEEHIYRNMDFCIRSVMGLADGAENAVPIETCFITMPSRTIYMNVTLEKNGIETEVKVMGEGQLGLLAGVFEREGFAALAGTGSDVFYIGPNGPLTVGGWGLMLGDEGSGSYVGRDGLVAAIRSVEGYGEQTELLGEMLEWLGADKSEEPMRVMRGVLVPKVYEAASPRGVLASFVPRITRACDRGDIVARRILENAGADMGMQMVALIKRMLERDPRVIDMPSTLCGGVWKSSRCMYRAYRDYVHNFYPCFNIQWPMFDAVAGAAVMIGFSLGYSKGEIRARLSETFKDYLYPAE